MLQKRALAMDPRLANFDPYNNMVMQVIWELLAQGPKWTGDRALWKYSMHCLEASEIRGYTDPGYYGHKFIHLLVGVTGVDFAMQELFVDEFIPRLEDEGVNAMDFNSVFPPTRRCTDRERCKIVNQMGIDAALFVSIGGSASSHTVTS
jgi:hypothetical protein